MVEVPRVGLGSCWSVAEALLGSSSNTAGHGMGEFSGLCHDREVGYTLQGQRESAADP